MKRIILFFAVCLGLSVSQTTFADDAEMARAASKRGQTNTVSVSSQSGQSSSRTISSSARKTENTQNKNSRTATKPTQQRVVGRTPSTQKQTVKQRSATAQPITKSEVKSRVSTTSRIGANRVVDARTFDSGALKTTRSATTTQKGSKKHARAAELNAEKISSIKTKDYSKCKTVYFECMDEFCANKDTNLRRCACSSRIHEFDGIKKQLSDAEDKMLDFNQRLLTVNLDKEDAAAINVASEGELAYSKKDTSESEKLLQKITSTLNNSGDSRLNNNLSSISLSLDMDTAWDSVDAMGGISTTSKNGLELYNAARPVCIEMAKEVCSDDELDVAQSSYKLTIEQDCNTVAKSYDTLYNQAQEKIHESSALLDMSRLNNYQQRNSDDILTCKKKILTQLADASVCGENLYKCLDTTGQYINPSTGKAFLSENLYDLTTLLQEPSGEDKWTSISQNEKFVNYLNAKKEFLEPATEQCEELSDVVWKDFLEDALAQIKLAQNAKLEEIRQSCTTLVAECKTKALTDLSEFDARALSTFNVLSDKTANAMCEEVTSSCVALMNNVDASRNWEQGIAGVSTDVSYETLIDTCTQIGRDCIVQQCNGTSGNFALCKKATDDKRIAILTRKACWNEVYNCIKEADNLQNMNYGILANRDNYYASLYSANTNDIPDPCENSDDVDKACLITEQIWGNCEFIPTKYNIVTNQSMIDNIVYGGHNQILIPNNGSTLLSWFASGTGTTSSADSCNAKGCPLDYEMASDGTCKEIPSTCLNTGKNVVCKPDNKCIVDRNQIIQVNESLLNYCESGVVDVYGNCCDKDTTTQVNGICVPNGYKSAQILQTLTCNANSSTENEENSSTTNTAEYKHYCPDDSSRKISVYCVSTNDDSGLAYVEEDNIEYLCQNGFWLLVDEYGNYFNVYNDNTTYTKHVNMTYYTGSCSAQSVNMSTSFPTDNEFTISY